MVHYKSNEEVEIMREGGLRLSKVVNNLIAQIKPGKTTHHIDIEAEKLIKGKEGKPSFKEVENYYWSTCVPINEQIVHTPPSERTLINGDVFTLDIGMWYKGYHTDYATTFIVGDKSKNEKILAFLRTGEKALEEAIKKAQPGNYIGDISATIQKQVEKNGYHCIKELTGHGIGHTLHEDPFIPGILDRPVESTLKIKPGLVIAIEVIYSMGNGKMKYEEGSDWSIVTADASISACFEHTIAVTEKGNIILTKE